MRTCAPVALALTLLLAAPALAAGPALETEDQKTVYALGLAVAQNLEQFTLSAAELDLVVAGIREGLAGKAQLDANSYRQKIQQLAQARAQAVAEVEKKASEEFLAKFAKEKGAEKTASGLIYIPLKAGTGDSPKATDTVKVHYTGTLRDGATFDSSVERGQPTTFPLNRVIPCWTEGLQKMKKGGKAKLVCPSGIAYGDRGAPPKIKGGAALVFEVELIDIEAPSAAAPAGHGGGDKPSDKPSGHP
jgi:FKBP-type peptidyl-prolyl cis-trans isomerase FkpA/FKBP-type peptidyl-prolyl cis-trans isomerase FklB